MTLHLTRITLNPADRNAITDLGDLQRLHRRLMLLVPDDLGDRARQQAGVLFRIDETASRTAILIQTRAEPGVDRIPSGYGTIEHRDISPLLEHLAVGTKVAYRITANPSKRNAIGEAAGKIRALNGAAADTWWRDKATACGMEPGQFSTVSLPDAVAKKGPDPRRWIRHGLRRFEGTATVTDPDALRDAVLSGIGRAKAYGAGLLSLRVLA
ncbi:type I-E CRISPR-associated protein Cas6/Cse3/CasE [Actinorhabdospora filicis]|uniref:Type I-E CRISPR-associated protein Cas6/Cse3/CasE n=1 Tax=Actinorhabdospora filicis TaxID=1785913 RepID=A0A9W6W992_9ACTN|nr:type I-E CRISPR-associated protein Cas6/Cse3/CasE [Actinorhabdospora filicis]GLZ78349.1 type I-E CRISPR-associated protein Cas6/Cse3/CasE [Actinorhabdospora filicis]